MGIRDTGNRTLMQQRHTEWVNLWNANCDNTRNPKTKRALLDELNVWERTLGGQIASATEGPKGFMAKDFDGDGWVKGNKADFDDLIRKAKKKNRKKWWEAAPVTREPGKKEDVEAGKPTPVEEIFSHAGDKFHSAATVADGIRSREGTDTSSPVVEANGDLLKHSPAPVDRVVDLTTPLRGSQILDGRTPAEPAFSIL